MNYGNANFENNLLPSLGNKMAHSSLRERCNEVYERKETKWNERVDKISKNK